MTLLKCAYCADGDAPHLQYRDSLPCCDTCLAWVGVKLPLADAPLAKNMLPPDWKGEP